MATATTYTKSGNKATAAAKLDSKVFGVKVESHELMKLSYDAYLANGRNSNATTKTRGLVSGGGRKPWRQKGTGRARFGSSRNPIWRGGGITFGPTGEQNYTKRLNVKAKRRATKQALSLAAQENRLKVIESLSAIEAKTKDIVKVLEKIDAKGRVVCVLAHKDLTKTRGTDNLEGVKVVNATNLNAFDLINADHVVIEQKALPMIVDWLGGKA